MNDERTPSSKSERYAEVAASVRSLLDGEDDWVAAMATVACELHHAFDHFHWTGFYRLVRPDLLVLGPYQGTHGCLRIPLDRGICGRAARTRSVVRVDDVTADPAHIACSTTTRSEIVVPVPRPDGTLLAVLDVDSNDPAAFDEADEAGLAALCADLGRRFEGVRAP